LRVSKSSKLLTAACGGSSTETAYEKLNTSLIGSLQLEWKIEEAVYSTSCFSTSSVCLQVKVVIKISLLISPIID